MKDVFRVRRMWRPRSELKSRYDVVIIGGGSHGLATAYYLAKNHGVRDIAVLEQSYIGSGASGRNTTIIRSNYRTPEGAAFYSKSVQLYENGRLLGSSESEKLMVAAGSHQLEIVSEGIGYRATKTVQVAGGKTSTLKIEFPPPAVA